MKKLVTILTVITLSFSSLFAGGFFDSNRFIEIRANGSVDASNNTIKLGDMLVENLIIDLTKLADSTPANGLVFSFDANPEVGIGFDFRKVVLNFNAGSDVNGGFVLSKDFFNLLGHGYDFADYTEEEPLMINETIFGDSFVYANAEVGFEIGKFGFSAKPTVFVPVLHVVPENTKITFVNTDEGKIAAEASTEITAYAVSNLDSKAFDLNNIFTYAGNSLGFDIDGAVSYSIMDNLNLELSARVPIIPGHLRKKAGIAINAKYTGNVPDFLEGIAYDEENTGFSVTDLEGNEVHVETLDLNWVECDYTINRPLKVGVSATYDIIPNNIILKGMAGLGILNPFSKNSQEISIFPEYNVGLKLSLGGVLKTHISTEYTDRIFKHEAGLGLNIRLVEVDIGASLQSADFLNSLKIAGLGAYVNICVGL